MAKLNGVKTLDMVNGETTKVAYGGAEYERVEGSADEFGRIGDLVLNGRIHCALTVGAFYEIVLHEAYGWKTVRDDIGDWHSAVLRHSGSVLFRKVSASTSPSLEERVSSAEGEIESLKSDVAALKGEPEYKLIDVAEAQEGDYVKFDEAPKRYLTSGKYYEIDYVDSQGDPWITDDDGDEFDTQVLHYDEFEVFRKVSAASAENEPKPEHLKVGAYAKVVDASDYHIFRDGDIVEIVEDPFTGSTNECARKITSGVTQYVPKRQLVRATDEEVAEAKDAAARAKFKKGAKVRLLSGGGEHPLCGFTDGKIYEVVNNNFDHPNGKRIQIEDGFATPDQLEILSEEEAAEIERQQAEEAKWAKIGRKVGEYKKGDVVTYDDPEFFENSGIGEVVSVFGGDPKVMAIDYEGDKNQYYLEPAQLRLITPVEARFDR
ncbi:hypothetical protein [Bacillus velezensis]|uniref:hypothetical protein n=1 Tax=Bacillus velezensis TaxID=492670 RepID=UPI000C1509DB|nr:hypothetical protein [Bacillus velezensis]